jgi:GTP-binding protein
MRARETDSTDTFEVCGRGELHLSILIETMRRQGYEFAVTRPKVIFKRDEAGNRTEPMEEATIDTPQEYVGAIMEKLGQRKAELLDMTPQGDRSMRLKFLVPARGLMGYRSELLTDTHGEGVISHIFHSYQPYKGEIAERRTGSLVAHETGLTSGYGLFYAQERGRMFVGSGVPVYEGQVVGECSRNEDIVVNVCKKKHVTNMRASGSDDALRLTPATVFSLEQCLEFLADDELLEVTPQNLRIRKQYLRKEQRIKAGNKQLGQN